MVAVVIFSLYYQEFRERLLLALLTAMLLAISHSFNWSHAKLWNNPLATLGRMSYSVFLVHFPVSLLISSAWANLYPTDPWMNVAGMGVSVMTSILVAIPFYRYIETRSA